MSEEETSTLFEEVLVISESEHIESDESLGDYLHAKALYVSDWWRHYRDGRYDNLPAT
jgi:hypothetical protein